MERLLSTTDLDFGSFPEFFSDADQTTGLTAEDMVDTYTEVKVAGSLRRAIQHQNCSGICVPPLWAVFGLMGKVQTV